MIWIIGKNASALTFPKDFFVGRETIGLNEAALVYGTSWAFSSYPLHIKEFLAAGVPINRILGVDPVYPIPGRRGRDNVPNKYPGVDSVLQDDRAPGKLIDIPNDMKELYEKRNKQHIYSVNGTVVQAAIYWCVLNNKIPVNIVGCNQDANCAPGICNDYKGCDRCAACKSQAWVNSRNYTREVIKCLNGYGDIVRFYENYADYVERSKA